VSREERLAIATQVLDNSSDLDSLREHVGALWDELTRLPHVAVDSTGQD
jgi:dephospho-CoA kinase